MAVDMFLKIEGIDGEAQDADHGSEIDVLAWSWGASQSGTTHVGGGSGSGKGNFQDISITKWVEKSTPNLLRYCSNGHHIPRARLTVRKAGEVPLEYVIIDMKDLIITSISSGGSGGEDRLTENITLNFAEFVYKYTPQNADGSGAGEIAFSWSIPENIEK